MAALPQPTLEIIKYLQSNNIDPILYGSQGVSLYLGNFKVFNDIDLLIDEKLLQDGWVDLQRIMGAHDFTLVDEHEHEFKNSLGITVNFGDEKILVRDCIMDSIHRVILFDVGEITIKTLSPSDFKLAYEFSAKDGYRIETRGKKDSNVIALLEGYIAEKSIN